MTFWMWCCLPNCGNTDCIAVDLTLLEHTGTTRVDIVACDSHVPDNILDFVFESIMHEAKRRKMCVFTECDST